MKSLVLTLILAAVIQAAPAVLLERATCTSISQRKAWHTMSRDEKLAYIEAEKCLMSTPAKLGLKGAKTRFDEFQKLHILNTEVVHGVGAFFPFHRYLMYVHETILKTECNYTGIQPYWQETLDAGNFTHSVVLDPEMGFGGDGAGPNNCIKDGPFKDYKNSLGPFQQIGDHCIDRKIDECMSAMAKQENVDLCMVAKNFSTAWPCFEGTVHGAGHGGIGAQMLNLYSSPGDPLFYLHHTYLDKLWWQWQEKDRTARLSDITGTNVGGSFFGGFPGNGSFPGFPTNGTFPGFPGNGTFPGFPPNGTFPGFPGNGTGNGTCFKFPGFPTPPHATEEQIAAAEGMPGDPGTTTTMGHVLTVYGMLPNITIADVMDTKGGYLCYEYI